MANNMYGVSLGDVQPVDNVITAPSVSSPAGTALDTLAQGLGALGNHWQRAAASKRQAAADARAAQDQAWQAEDRAKKAATDSVEDLVAQGTVLINGPSGLGDFLQAPPAQGGPAIKPLPPELVNTLNKSIDTLRNTQLAVDQGKLPAISRESQVQLLFNRIVASHPEYAAEAAKAFRDNGVGDALTSEISREVDQRTAAGKAQQDEDVKAVNYAAERTPPAVFAAMSVEQKKQQGYTLMASDNELDHLAKQASIDSSKASTANANYGLTRQQASDKYFQVVTTATMDQLNPTFNALNKLLLAAGEPGANAGRETQIADLVSMAHVQVDTAISNAISRAGLTNQKDVEAVSTRLHQYADENFFNHYEQRSKDFAQASSSISTYTGLSAAQSAPLISSFRRLGIPVASIPGIAQAMQNFDPATQAKLTAELTGAAKLQPGSDIATIHLTNTLEVLKGMKTLNDITDPNQRRQVVATNYGYVMNNGKAVGRGQGDSELWMNGARTLVLASSSFDPQTDISTLHKAARALFNSDSVTAVERLAGQPETSQEGTLLVQGMSASAGHILNNTISQMRGSNANLRKMGYSMVVTNEGKYAIKKDPNWKPAPRSAMYVAGVQVPTGLQSRLPVPQQYIDMVDTANRSLNFIIVTGKYDPEAVKGTPREIRRSYTLGELTPDQQKKLKSGKEGAASVDQMIASVKADLSQLPDLVTPPVDTGGSGTSRGERNNNAGNIKDGAFAKSQPGYTGSDGTFATFDTPEHGQQAQETLLSTNYFGKGLNTVNKVVDKYLGAGDSENSKESRANYKRYVAKRLGVNPDDTLSPDIIGRFAEAMREFETGNRSA